MNILFEKHVSVSYRRIKEISRSTANAVINVYERENVVCPPSLKDGVFTTGNLDNIDHNPSSTSAQSSFHGTALSLTQHLSNENPGFDRPQLNDIIAEQINVKPVCLKEVPETYSVVPPVELKRNVEPPTTAGLVTLSDITVNTDVSHEQWLSVVRLL